MFRGMDSWVVFLVIVVGILIVFGGLGAVMRRRDINSR